MNEEKTILAPSVTNGNRVLIESGSFMAFLEGKTELQVSYKEDVLFLYLEFPHDESGKFNGKVEIVPGGIAFIFTNLSDVPTKALASGVGFGPVEGGTIANERFWIALRFSPNLQGGVHVVYSVYIQKEEDHAQN